MSDLFTRLRDGAGLRILTKYGDVFRITKQGSPTFNPQTGGVTASTITQDVVGKSFSKEEDFDNGEMAQRREVEIFLTASGMDFAPEAGMTIKTPATSTDVFQITKAQPIPESGVAVIYRVMAVR